MKPKLRFKEFTDDWEEKKLGQIAQFFSGGTPKSTNKEYYIGNIPFIRSGEINEIDTELFINELALKNSSAKLVHQGDILYAMYGATAGNVSISKIDGAINQAILCIRTLENSIYIQQYLKRNKEKYLNIYLQGGQGNLSANIISGFKIQLPSLPEQEKIATFLSLVDQRIEKQERKVALLEEEKKGYMQQIFNQELRFKDEEGNNYPDWKEKKLGEISEKIQRGASPRPITDEKWFDETSDIGWIRISDITRSGKYIYDVKQKLSEEGIAKSRYLEVNNLVLSIAATIGKPVINKIPVCIHDGFIVFKNIYPSNDLEFLYYLLIHLQKEWLKYQQPGSQANLNSDLVRNQKIQLPCLSEQEKIANFLGLLDQRIEKGKEMLNLMKKEKQGLMQKMFV